MHIYHSSQSILALLLAAIKAQSYMWGERWLKVHTVLYKAGSLILYSISCCPQIRKESNSEWGKMGQTLFSLKHVRQETFVLVRNNLYFFFLKKNIFKEEKSIYCLKSFHVSKEREEKANSLNNSKLRNLTTSEKYSRIALFFPILILKILHLEKVG